MDLRPIFFVIGILLSILSIGMVVPMLADLYFAYSDWRVFFVCIVITAFFGGSLILSNAGQNFHLNVRQAFVLTVASWVAMAAFGALPFALSELHMSFTDAFFESVSGITTTGVSVIRGLEEAPPGILLWRAILNWLGGLGFIVMALSILPFLKVGGMQLFRTESSEREKALPRSAQLARAITYVYTGLTVACMICYMAAGMGTFDAIAHAMSTLATGGFSTHDNSFMGYKTPWIEIVAMVFMLSSGMPFILYIKALGGNPKAFLQDSQVRWFLTIVAVSIVILTAYLTLHDHFHLLEALRRVSFNVVSIMTNTGFANADISKWGWFAGTFLMFLSLVGACSGSTAGAIKIFRFQILYAVMQVQIKKLLYPHAVFIPYYNGKPIAKDIPLSVMSYFFAYILTFVFGTIIMAGFNLDLMTASSAVASSLGNAGIALGDVIGPTGSFGLLPDGAKWVLSSLMLLGRLELFTVFVLFSVHFWKH